MWRPIDMPVTEDNIKQAHELREYRDTFLENDWPARENDTRWHGDLGEIVLDDWLDWLGVEHTWFYDPRDGNPDFIIGGQEVETKTRYSNYRPLPGWQIKVRKDHLAPPKAPWYAFMFYQPPPRIMWVVGVSTPQCFIEHSRLLRVGEPFGLHDEVIKGNDQYQCQGLHFLTHFNDWLGNVGKAQ